jgi:putative glutamine amidotransferase
VKIGLTQTENPEKHQFYINWLKGNEDIEIITLSPQTDAINKIRDLDALVLSGGVDIHPELYGGSLVYPQSPVKGWSMDRDLMEKSLFESAIGNDIPVLGICRGLQLINVALGGTLIQDLGDELNAVHEGNPDKSHDINIEPGTILSGIVDSGKSKTNSAHHQAIGKLGEGLLINAKSGEGIVEGIEWSARSGRPFLLAIQWHPERMFRFNLEDSAVSKAIRTKFVEEVKKSKTSKDENH